MQNLYTSNDFQQQHSTTTDLATALSEHILNTTPGTAGTQALLQSMANDPLSKVVHDLLTSDASLANLIDTTYVQTLRRHATTSEVQTWTPQLKSGAMTLDSLAQRLLASQEFYQLAAAKVHL
jgi:hypothetical protein